MKTKNAIQLAGFVLFCELAGLIGGFFTFPAIGTWYASLAKPDFTPPNWIFGPVWTILYALMGYALWRAYEKPTNKTDKRTAYAVFGIQLGLNALWSIVFFGMQNTGGGLLIIAGLWLAILANMYAFSKIDRTAALALAPYLLWVSFAGALNYAIWTLN